MRKRYFVLPVIAMVLTACAQLGLLQPKEQPEKIAYGYGTLTQIRTQAAMLLKQKQLSVETAKQIQQLTDVARAGLDKARDLFYAGNLSESQKQLELSSTLLREAQQYLERREKLKPSADARGGRLT